MQLFFLVLLFLAICYIGVSWALSIPILSPKSSLAISRSVIKADWGTTYEEMVKLLPKPTDFSVVSFDGVTLQGKYFAREDSPKYVIIAAHGWTCTWADMLKYVPTLADCPCDLILYDQRGHGLSDSAYPTGGINESKDLLAVTEWVQKNKGFQDQEVGWLGASWGGAAALQAGATEKNVGFIIVDAPFQNWYSAIFERAGRNYGAWTRFVSIGIMEIVNWRTGVDYRKASPLQAAKKITAPVLLIHSQMDTATDSQQSVNIAKNLNAKSVFHHLTWGGGHTLDVVIHQDKFRAIVNDFLKTVDKNLLRPH